MKLVFATNNKHKLEELSKMISTHFELVGLSDIGCNDDIPETAPTLEGNALQKAQYIYTKFGINCFADDTGLEIEALDNRPGVYSARYAGENRDAKENVAKVLFELNEIKNRNARFRTVIALLINGEEFLFEGVCNGKITTEQRGDSGFGYDPIFMPDGYSVTFAEMDMVEKNSISHRGRAVAKLVDFLSITYKRD